jgi:hypothetical protein
VVACTSVTAPAGSVVLVVVVPPGVVVLVVVVAPPGMLERGASDERDGSGSMDPPCLLPGRGYHGTHMGETPFRRFCQKAVLNGPKRKASARGA